MCLKFEEYNKHLKGMIKTGTTTIQLTQSANGKKMKSISDKFLTAIISLAATSIVMCGGFLWKTNAALSRIEEHQIDTDRKIDNMQSQVNEIQIKLIDTKERLIRIETLQKH